MGPLILLAALSALGAPFAAPRPAVGRAYAALLVAVAAWALGQDGPERLLLSHKLQLAVQLQPEPWGVPVALGLLGAVMRSTSPRLWSAAGLGLCASMSMNPAFTALCLGLCAFNLSGGAAIPAAWIAGLSLWAGVWAGEGSAALTLLLGVGLVWSAGAEARLAALIAAAMFVEPGFELAETGVLGPAVTVALLGGAVWTGRAWMATLALGLSFALLGEPGLPLCLMVLGLLPEPGAEASTEASSAPLSRLAAAAAALALLVLGAGLGPAPVILPLAVALWATLRRPPDASVAAVLGPLLALATLLWRWGPA